VGEQSGGARTVLSLPEGGGSIKGIGESFQANLFSGTANHSIPVALSAGRNGFGPKLYLEYSSGSGNGVFGLGWDIRLPRIARKTEKGLPRYSNEDVFVLSGAEDLVPLLTEVVDPAEGDVRWMPEEPVEREDHAVFRYRPRTEGLFARIERWVHLTSGEMHWRSVTGDNVTSLFGTTHASRLADPADARRVSEWLLAETFDAFGNRTVYEYAADDPALYTDPGSVEHLPELFEQRRSATQRYLRRICYGNLPDPLVDEQQRPVTYGDGTPVGRLRGGRRYAFEVVFDYGDWDVPTVQQHPEPLPDSEQELFGRDVPLRPDRFSTFRAGFDVRTVRRCRRVLMFHHFAPLGGPTLVRSNDLTYRTDPETRLSLLSSATVTGYDRSPEDGAYRAASLPAVVFSYESFKPQEQRYRPLRAVGRQLPPLGLNDSTMTLVDLFGDGLPDVLHTGPAGIRYWRNLGDGLLDRPRVLDHVPAGISLDQPGVGFGDMAGDGIADLLVNTGPLPGFFETTPDGAWDRFVPYESPPGFTPQDPNVRLLDLTGDGRADALVTEDERFLWFECRGEQGFAPPRAVGRVHDLNEFPDVYFSDPTRRVRLADMTGDGLNDIVLVHDGSVDYWPNLGYGRFGRRVSMTGAPRLEGDFDPARLFLADVNGTGCADLVYVEAQRVCFWFNQSGNAWSERHVIVGTPRTTDASAVQFADIFGIGTTTLLWSSDAAGSGEDHYRALDFCGGVKPYVLNAVDNNMGATTRVSYAPSTRHLLRDRADGTPWLSLLPFPVQVVDKVEVVDHIGRTSRVSTYRYHHGHFDGREREFRGFGRVDQFDTESMSGSTDDGQPFPLPPTETRTWFHTGVYFDEDLTKRYQQEYYPHDQEAEPLPEHAVATGDAPAEAYRALRGAQLRTEVYARDGNARAAHPYEVSERRYRVKRVQPRQGNRHGVYLAHPLEALTYHYERNPFDPRVSHELTLEVDAYGNTLRALSVGYGRRQPDPDLPAQADRDRQQRMSITYTESSFTNAIDDPVAHPDSHLTPRPAGTRGYELTGFTPAAAGASRFSHDEWTEDEFARITGAPTIPYEAQPGPATPQKRLIEHTRTQYRRDDLTVLLPHGVLEPLGLAGEGQRLAFTAGLLDRVYGNRVDPAMLSQCGYVPGDDPSTWWIPSGRVFYSPDPTDSPAAELTFARQHYFVPHRTRDPFGTTSRTLRDPYVLLVDEQHDALDNRTLAEQDYRVLQPFRLTDPNGNREEVAFDTLGLVAGTARMGKAPEMTGDSLAGFVAEIGVEQRDAFFTAPMTQAAALLGDAGTRVVYDLDRFQREGQPVCAAILARETHASDTPPPDGPRVQVRLGYSDGFGRQIQQTVMAEAGPVADGGPVVDPRWIVSGWTVLNNKGKPVRQFEPFFVDNHAFRFDPRRGVSSMVCYDPLGRIVATLHPNHSWEKVVFTPWQQVTWDVNDTVAVPDPAQDEHIGGFLQRLPPGDYLPTWSAQRLGGALGPVERAAAEKAAVHAATPLTIYFDALGRPFLTVAENRFALDDVVTEERYASRVTFDVEGNEREIVDAHARIVMRHDFDMLGTRVRQSSMEAGDRWMLNDVGGQVAFTWNSRGHRLRSGYDALRRPVEVFLRDGDAPERLIGRTVFGESVPNPRSANLRGRVHQHYDQAGVLTSEAYDFKGNLLVGKRQLAREYRTTLDWSASPALDDVVYVSRTDYDALNRAVTLAAPDGTVTRQGYDRTGRLSTVDVTLRGGASPTPFVTGTDYDAKGQRTTVLYGNGVRSRYTYDALTYRLARCETLRGSQRLQDLRYTYDPAGNVTQIGDDAQQTLFFGNSVVSPDTEYTYDAVYRLLVAHGREHIGQASQQETTWDDAARRNLPLPGDGQAMRRYTEQYSYDAVGNLMRLVHRADNGNWNRAYTYQEASLLEPGKSGNRLSRTVVGNRTPEVYPYDAHGNITAMPHLASMGWDYRDQLRTVDLGGGGTAYYVYDAGGQRIRKVVEKNGGALVEERVSLGGFEVFRRRTASGVTLERETVHVMDDRQRIAVVDTRTQGSEPGVAAQSIRYQLGNHLGSVAVELDAAGQLISHEEYYSYGGTSYQAGRTAAEVGLKRYRYTSMERDGETGLNHHGARYYAPWLGRWLSPDPAGIADDVNVYAFVRSNPIRATDRTGFGALDWINENVLQPTADFIDEHGIDDAVAGFGDNLSFGLTRKVRQALDIDGSIDYNSTAYAVGGYAGTGVGLAMGGLGAAKIIGRYGFARGGAFVTGFFAAQQTATFALDKADPSGWASGVFNTALLIAPAFEGPTWGRIKLRKPFTEGEVNAAVGGKPSTSLYIKDIPAEALETGKYASEHPLEPQPYAKGGKIQKTSVDYDSSVPGVNQKVKTTMKWHDADPTAPAGKTSRNHATASIEQAKGKRRMVSEPNEPSGGRWVHEKTATQEEWGEAHMLLHPKHRTPWMFSGAAAGAALGLLRNGLSQPSGSVGLIDTGTGALSLGDTSITFTPDEALVPPPMLFGVERRF
jgi:RHS repeat-associated protein